MDARHDAFLARQPSATLKTRERFCGMPKRGLAFLLANVMFWQPIWAQADGVVVASPGTSLGQSGNGVPIVNIAAANGSGLSHNQFVDYNVGSQGVILNNITSRTGATQLGGIVVGNPHLSNGVAAQTILNEVIGGSPSQLRGYTEVAGQSARVTNAGKSVVASRNLTVNSLHTLNNQGGTLSAAQTANITSGTLENQNNGRVMSGAALNITANQVFNVMGVINSASNLTGSIDQLNNSNGEISSTGITRLNAAALNNRSGHVLGDLGLLIDLSGALDNRAGVLGSGKHVDLNAVSLDNRDAGVVVSDSSLNARISGLLDNQNAGEFRVKGAIDISSGSLDNRGGKVSGKDTLTLSSDFADNRGGAIQSDKQLKLQVGQLDNRDKGLISGKAGIVFEGTAQIIGVLGGALAGGDPQMAGWVAGNAERYNQQVHREAAARLEKGFASLHEQNQFVDLQPQDVLADLQKIAEGEKDPAKLNPGTVEFLNQFSPGDLREIFFEPTLTEQIVGLGIDLFFPTPTGKGRAAATISGPVGKDILEALEKKFGAALAQGEAKASGASLDNVASSIHAGQQGKHVLGHNNFIPGRSHINEGIDPQKLLNGAHAGEFPVVGYGSRGQPIVDFGQNIGVDGTSGLATKFGTIHSGNSGAHIVPTNPATVGVKP